MKRIFSVLLMLTLALSLAACGEAPASSVPPASSEAGSVLEKPAVPGPYTEMQQLSLAEYGELTLYPEPDLETEPLLILQPDFGQGAPYCIAKQENWLQCVCGSYAGWVHDIVPEAESAAIPIPDFLTEEQQLLYVQAVSLFNAYNMNVSGQKGFADRSTTLEIQADGDYFFGYPDQLYPTADALKAALNSVFTAEYLAEDFLPYDANPYILREENGRLYVGSSDRGSWTAHIVGYTLTEQTDEHILFSVQFHFGEAEDWQCELPVELVNTPDGWRVAQMTTVYDDLHWMEAMGPDFDPWAAMGTV